ncbi:hypothetical protein ES703_21202 [subsurface metagenome]
MFNKVLVPLDGSKLAECVLPYVEELATHGVAEEVPDCALTTVIIRICLGIPY